jgi:hypothetical protein
MKVGKLTTEQKNQLVNQQFLPNCYFNPLEDNNGDWVISIEEMNNCTNEEFQWVKTLPLIDYVPKSTVDPLVI